MAWLIQQGMEMVGLIQGEWKSILSLYGNCKDKYM